MAGNMFNAITETLIRGKDKALSELARFLANRLQLARYGEMIDCRVDTLTKEIHVSLRLNGEQEIIETRILYCLEHDQGKTALVAERIWVSREWVNSLANDLAESRGRRLELPPKIALAAKILRL